MDNNYTLIMPMLGRLDEKQMPLQYQYDKHGNMNCLNSLFNINTEIFSDVYFIVSEKHDKLFNISNKIEAELEPCHFNFDYHIEVTSINTHSQAETIYQVLKKMNNDITGPIFIKDADNTCLCKNLIKGNSVLVYSLENTPIVDPLHKSYINIDEQNFITNIIEKRVVSGLFNCGGYSFADANDFIEAYEALTVYENLNADIPVHMYISHIIYWLILNKNAKFRPIIADWYNDYEINDKLNNILI